MIPTIDTTKIGLWIIRLLVATSILGLVFALIPPYPLPDEIATAVTWLVQCLVNFNFLIPVSTMLQIAGLTLLCEVVFLSIRLFLFLNGYLNRSGD